MNLYVIFDIKAAAYLPPFPAKTDGLAERQVLKAGLDPQHDFHQFCTDYMLFRVARFDELTGQIEPQDTYDNLGSVQSLLARFAQRDELEAVA